MGSMYWTAEEARYLKAIFSWQDRFDDEQDGGTRVRDAAAKACVGDFRVLMIGAKGVGKTALLTRFCDGTFQDAAPDPRFVRGGRRPVRIDSLLYNMDVLEMPSQHLAAAASDGGDGSSPSPAAAAATPAAMMLEQALAITEAAIVVYDVCSPASFLQAQRLYKRLQQDRGPGAARQRQRHSQQQQRGGGRDAPGSRKSLPKKKSMLFRSHKKEQQQQQQQLAQLKRSTSSSSSAAAASKNLARPFALLLVGNKSDGGEGGGSSSGAQRVAWADGNQTAAGVAGGGAQGAAPPPPPLPTLFLEASAKTGDNVDDVFVRIGREILRQRAERQRQANGDDLAGGRAGEGESSAASSTTTNNSLLRIKSQASTTRRTFGVLRVLGLTFGRRAGAMDTPAMA